MPEGDSLHRAAAALQELVGEQLRAESPHPRASVTGVAEAVDGRRLLAVDAVGKNLLLRFEGDIVVRSHLRMTGRWRVGAPRRGQTGRPWLVLSSGARVATLWNGPVLELGPGATGRLGPDILAEPPAYDSMIARLRGADSTRELGEALLDQRLVAGIGNMWKAEALWASRLSPWRRLADSADVELQSALEQAAALMRARLHGARVRHAVYRRARRPCRRCGDSIAARRQGAGTRTTYWCPGCQR